MDFFEFKWYCGNVDDCLRCHICPYEQNQDFCSVCDMVIQELKPKPYNENYEYEFWLTAESFFTYTEGEN